MREEGEELGPGDTFHLAEDGADDPRPILRRLVDELEEFKDLRIGEAAFMVVFRAEPKVKQGRMILGTMGLPRFQGGTADFATWCLAKLCGGDLPDFVLTLDAEWWADAEPFAREALVYHELCHCEHANDKDGEPKFTDEGMPVWGIRGHDLEEFHAVVRRYGAWAPDVQTFANALAAGGVKASP